MPKLSRAYFNEPGFTLTKLRDSQVTLSVCRPVTNESLVRFWLDYVSRKIVFAMNYGETMKSWGDW
jgi:hypothetical protein